MSKSIQKAATAILPGMLGYAIFAWFLSSAAEPRAEFVEAPLPEVPSFPTHQEKTKLLLHKAGFKYKCRECHDNQTRDPSPREFVGEHRELKFNHGLNRRCFNCHHPEKYDKFIGHNGQTLDYSKHVALCATCHGPVYRDWKMGAHGRRKGRWDQPELVERTDCIICHDPHHPSFQPIQPMPPPGVAIGEPKMKHAAEGFVGRMLQEEAIPKKPESRGPAPRILPEEGAL